MARAAVVAVLVLSLLVAAAWVFQRRLIYFPGPPGVASPVAQTVPHARIVELVTSDGLRLGALFAPASRADGVVVLVTNGNGGDRTGRIPLAQALAARGIGVLLFDYRGYAGNPGTPSESGLAKDAVAAYDFLVEEAAVDPARLIYFGESLGTGVATALAVRRPPGGLVLRSPFVDLASVGSAHYPFLPVRLLLRDRYPVAEQLRDVRAPVTIVYGSADALVFPRQSRAVAAAVRNLRQVVEVKGAGHNDAALAYGPAVVEAIVDMADAAAGNR